MVRASTLRISGRRKSRACANTQIKRANGEQVPSFEDYDKISQLIEVDTGPTIAQLARVSHVHLFGISIIFFITGSYSP